MAASRSEFLDAQFLQSAHHGRAFGKGGGDGEDRIFVDHGRRARRRHLDAAQSAGANAQIGDVLAAFVAFLEPLDASAHLAERREKAGAQRIHHHAAEDHFRAGHDQSGDQRKCRRRRIGGDRDRPRRQFRLAGERDAAAIAISLAASGSTRTSAPK